MHIMKSITYIWRVYNHERVIQESGEVQERRRMSLSSFRPLKRPQSLETVIESMHPENQKAGLLERLVEP